MTAAVPDRRMPPNADLPGAHGAKRPKINRERIEAVYTAYRKHQDAGDWHAWVDLLSEDCSVLMPILAEPMRGRENRRAFAAGWPNVSNRAEWFAIDGNRLVFAWNTRNDHMPNSAGRYRGVATLVFDSAAQLCEIEERFDTAVLAELERWRSTTINEEYRRECPKLIIQIERQLSEGWCESPYEEAMQRASDSAVELTSVGVRRHTVSQGSGPVSAGAGH